MGIIQCGSFTGNTTVNIGWEPQWIMIKRTGTAGDWIVIDSMRGCSAGGVDAVLNPNLSNAESVSNDYIDFTATGFITKNLTGTYIYTVIRRPNKPPKSGTEVYNAIARTGTGATATVTGVGFAPDLVIPTALISSGGSGSTFHDRLRGKQNILFPTGVNAELERTDASMYFRFGSDGIEVGADTTSYINYTGYPYINHFFRRAPGFFDVVTYTGNGIAGRQIPHSLGVVPGMVIVKSTSTSVNWVVRHRSASGLLLLNTTDSQAAHFQPIPAMDASTFTVGAVSTANDVGVTYVAYLFATFPGISKVGSYTGNGTSQTINCGFSTGARFILIKRTDATGDWYVWDSVRGIVAANDPHLSLNTTAAEVTTDDSVDPNASGFIVNQNTATNINVNGGQYIFLAIA